MHSLSLTIALNTAEDTRSGWYFDYQLHIDGHPLHDEAEHLVDFGELVASAQAEPLGAEAIYWIYLCGCGCEGCTSIDEGVGVAHVNDVVVWRVRQPLAWPGNEDLPEWSRYDVYLFDRNDYMNTIRSALTSAKDMVSRWSSSGQPLWLGPHLTAHDLIKMKL